MLSFLDIESPFEPRRRITTQVFNMNAGQFGVPCLIYAGGALSDPVALAEGGRAKALHEMARLLYGPFKTFNYLGHGAGATKSDGQIIDCSLGRMQADTEAVLASAAQPSILVASSTAGAFALYAAAKHNAETKKPNKVAGLVLLNPIPAEALIDVNYQQGRSQQEVAQHYVDNGFHDLTGPTLPRPYRMGVHTWRELPKFCLSNPAHPPIDSTLPTTIISGTRDSLSRAYLHHFKQALPEATVMETPEGHELSRGTALKGVYRHVRFDPRQRQLIFAG